VKDRSLGLNAHSVGRSVPQLLAQRLLTVGYPIVGRVSDAADLIDPILKLRSDVVVLDLRMLHVTGFAICCMMKREAQTGT